MKIRIILFLIIFSPLGVTKETSTFLKTDRSDKIQAFVKKNKSFFEKLLLDHIVEMDKCFMTEKENLKCKEKYYSNYHQISHKRNDCYSWYKNKPKEQVQKCQKHYDTKNFFEFEKMMYIAMLRWNVFDKRKELVQNEYIVEYTPSCSSDSYYCIKAPYRNSGKLGVEFKGFSEYSKEFSKEYRKNDVDWNYNVSSFSIIYNKKLENYEELLDKKLIVGVSLDTISLFD